MNRKHIAVIDYGMGNLHSVASALKKVAPDAKISVTAEHRDIEQADHVVFPGVGAIRDCMAEILRLEFDQAVNRVIASGRPLLAVCIGMQALMENSRENGGVTCLAQFKGSVNYFSDTAEFNPTPNQGGQSTVKMDEKLKLKVPHMGWNQVKQVQDHPLWRGIEDNSRFYFVHSYFVAPHSESLTVGTSHYGIEFTAAMAEKNVFAVQFHPEKSHTKGLQLLKNFVAWDGRYE